MSTRWTAEEERVAREMALARTPTVHIAHHMRRSEKGVIRKLKRLGVAEATLNRAKG